MGNFAQTSPTKKNPTTQGEMLKCKEMLESIVSFKVHGQKWCFQ